MVVDKDIDTRKKRPGFLKGSKKDFTPEENLQLAMQDNNADNWMLLHSIYTIIIEMIQWVPFLSGFNDKIKTNMHALAGHGVGEDGFLQED